VNTNETALFFTLIIVLPILGIYAEEWQTPRAFGQNMTALNVTTNIENTTDANQTGRISGRAICQVC
jgi:hypothetical protein